MSRKFEGLPVDDTAVGVGTPAVEEVEAESSRFGVDAEDPEYEATHFEAFCGCLAHALGMVVLLIIVGLCMLFLNSCKEYVEVEKRVEVVKVDTFERLSLRVDTLRLVSLITDTLRERDSIVVYVDGEGKEQIKYVYRDRDRVIVKVDTVDRFRDRIDTVKVVEIAKTDSLATVAKESKAKTSIWEKVCIMFGRLALVALAVLGVVYLGRYLWGKIKND